MKGSNGPVEEAGRYNNDNDLISDGFDAGPFLSLMRTTDRFVSLQGHKDNHPAALQVQRRSKHVTVSLNVTTVIAEEIHYPGDTLYA